MFCPFGPCYTHYPFGLYVMQYITFWVHVLFNHYPYGPCAKKLLSFWIMYIRDFSSDISGDLYKRGKKGNRLNSAMTK